MSDPVNSSDEAVDDGFETKVYPPGVTTEHTALAEFLSIEPGGEIEQQLQADFAAIREAERQAAIITKGIHLD